MCPILQGPILKTWFKILDKKIGSATKTAVFKKVIVDQTMFAPVFTGLVVSLVGATQGNDLEGIKKKLENEYGDILINHYKVSIPTRIKIHLKITKVI